MAEDPTRRQQAPRDPAGGGRGEVYEEYEAEPGPSRAELADQARSSRNWAYAAAFRGERWGGRCLPKQRDRAA
jgi:hypothetical protein